MIKFVDICAFGWNINEVIKAENVSDAGNKSAKTLVFDVFGAERADDLLLPKKPSLRSRHEFSGDSGTNDQKTPEICLKSQLTTYLVVQTETRVITAHHCVRWDYFGTFKVCFFQP